MDSVGNAAVLESTGSSTEAMEEKATSSYGRGAAQDSDADRGAKGGATAQELVLRQGGDAVSTPKVRLSADYFPNKDVPRPKKLEEFDEELIRQVLDKYGRTDLVEVIEALVCDSKPVTELGKQLDKDYLMYKFLQLGLTARREYDQIKAFENIARMQGYYSEHRQASPLNIQFKTIVPAEVDWVGEEA